MPAPLFTIVTITYNQEQWIKQAIDSVLASSFPEFEYIIADDCSADNTWNIVNEYNDPRIRRYRNNKNIHEYPNRNKALSLATGKYILFVDGDDILYKHTLRNLAETIQEFPGAGMIWGVPDSYFYFAVLPYEFSSAQLLNLLYRTYIPLGVTGLSETVFKTDILKEVGGFSTEYGIGDYYIKLRLSVVTSAVFVPRGLAFWRQNENQATVQVSKRYRSFIEKNKIDYSMLPLIEKTLNKEDFDVVLKNIEIQYIKLLVTTTLFKGKFSDFVWVYKRTNTSLKHLKYLLKKGDYSYSLSYKRSAPLMNAYHLK